ncbi:MAG: hypothetical protein AABW50_05225 [Nanoarchaeota archaeon]
MAIKRIIVEGSDCSGKSTVVERLKNFLRWDSKSLHHIEGDQFKRYLREYSFSDFVIFDRSHFSEIVYSILWRNGSPFSESEKMILDFLAQKETIIILSCPSLELMKERYSSRNFTQQIKLEELEKARNLFLEALEGIPYLFYSSKNFEELDFLIEKVKEIVK